MLSCIANFAVQYDDEKIIIQKVVREENALAAVQFERLIEAIGIILLGLTIEQLKDRQAKRTIFGLMATFSAWIFYHEVMVFGNPIKNKNGGADSGQLEQAMLLTIRKLLQLIQVIAMAKWFSRYWFPFWVSLWCLSQNLSEFLKKGIECE